MPFDGTEFVGSPVQTASTPPKFLALLRDACRRLRPTGRALAFDLPPSVPVEAPGVATVQVLRLARTLIEDERHWIQRRYETLDGRRCAVGALRSASRLLSMRSLNNEAHNLLLEVAVGRGFSDIEKMNDHSTHGQVVTAFDIAIARAHARL